jgi:hypothetical protein
VKISGYDHDDLSEVISDSPAAGYLPKNALGAEAIAGVLQAD